MSLAVGARCGAYEIVAPVGAGGMGEVFRAIDVNLGRAAAIKVLPASLATNPERLARFEREAHTLALLNHPNPRRDRFVTWQGPHGAAYNRVFLLSHA